MKNFKNIGKALSRSELKNITGGDFGTLYLGFGTGSCSGSCGGMDPFGINRTGQCKVPTNPTPDVTCYCDSPYGSANQCQ